MILGVVVRTLRIQQHLTQIEASRQAGVSHSWLSKVENGHILQPNPHLLQALAVPLATKAEDLMILAGIAHPVDHAINVEELSVSDLLTATNRMLLELARRAALNGNGTSTPAA